MQQLAVGDCFDDVFAGDDFDFDAPPAITPCDSAHDNEVIATAPFAVSERPSDDALFASADAACAPKFTEHLGPADRISDLVGTWSVIPDEAEWAAGVRHAFCVVFGSGLIGSIRSAGLNAPRTRLAAIGEIDGFTVVQVFDGDTGTLESTLSDPTAFAQSTPPGWGATGDLVLYAQGPNDTDRTLYSSNGTTTATLLSDVEAAGNPRLDDPGTRLAYIATDNGGDFDIYVKSFMTGATVRLTTNPGRDTSPAWSPDGSRLAFRSSVTANSDVWVMDADGKNLLRLTDSPGFDGDPVWSPDGTRIAFTSDRSGNFDVWVMRADGSAETQVTDHPADDEYPTWSPDGSMLAFQTDRTGGPSIWIMTADGRSQSSLIPDAPVAKPSFSPASG